MDTAPTEMAGRAVGDQDQPPGGLQRHAQKAHLAGNVRAFSRQVMRMIEANIKRTASHAAKASDALCTSRSRERHNPQASVHKGLPAGGSRIPAGEGRGIVWRYGR